MSMATKSEAETAYPSLAPLRWAILFPRDVADDLLLFCLALHD